MPGERTVLSTLGTVAAAVESEQVRPPAIVVIGDVVAVANPETLRRREVMAVLTEVVDPDDPRLADYRDLRDVELRKHLEAEHGLFLAEGEKVVRRAVEAGYAPRSFLMAPRWLDGLADVLAADRRPLLRGLGGARRAGHRLPRAPRRARLAATAGRCRRSTRCWRARARSWCSRTSSTTPTSGAILRSGAALDVDAVLLSPRCADPLYRRAVKVGDGRGVLDAVDAAGRLVRRAAVAVRAWLHHGRA